MALWEGQPRELLRQRHRRCEFAGGCETRPSYGDARDAVVRYCLRHKGHADVNLRVRLCEEQGCGKQSSFGAPGEPYRYCAEHKRSSDINTRSARCSSPKSVKASGADELARNKVRGIAGQRKRNPATRLDAATKVRWEAQTVVEKNVDLMAQYVDTLIGCSSPESSAWPGERGLKYGSVQLGVEAGMG